MLLVLMVIFILIDFFYCNNLWLYFIFVLFLKFLKFNGNILVVKFYVKMLMVR